MRRIIVFSIFMLLLASLMVSCERDVTNKNKFVNKAPNIFFVNIPTEGSKFSSDTSLYWYGTDQDGFVDYFRYMVVRTEEIINTVGEPMVGGNPDWEAYMEAVTVDTIPFIADTFPVGKWHLLEVMRDNPQTHTSVSMSASDTQTVRVYAESYVIIQAIDDDGAMSEPKARSYLKNNHYPDTRISARAVADPYVNTTEGGGVLQGVSISWQGTDEIDYPRNPPPFEFQWKLFGPYDSTQMQLINNTTVESVFVSYNGDFLQSGDTIDFRYDTTVVGIDTTFDTTAVIVDDLARGNPYGEWEDWLNLETIDTLTDQTGLMLYNVVEESFNPQTGTPWISDTRANIYDVYRNLSVDTTSQYNFLFWCQSRDDSKVPDSIAAFHWLAAIEPKFEREVIIIDVTPYKKSGFSFWNWPIFPQLTGNAKYDTLLEIYNQEPLVKRFYGTMVNNWAGFGKFDIDTKLPNVTPIECGQEIAYEDFHATQDYYPIIKLDKCESQNIPAVTLRDILKHKKIILTKDSPGVALNMANPIIVSVIDGLNAGMSCWSLVRNPFQTFVGDPTIGGTNSCNEQGWTVDDAYQEYFGIECLHHTGWVGLMNADLENSGTRIEDFIGATPSRDFVGILPELSVDTTLLENSYIWMPGNRTLGNYDFRCWITGEILVGALPEVGYVQKSTFADALYNFVSIYGNSLDSNDVNAEPASFFRKQCDGRDVGRYRDYSGTKVAIRYDAGLFRTSHFSFSLLPFDQNDAQEVFDFMMDWFTEKVPGTGKISPNQPAPYIDVERLRVVTEDLHERMNFLRENPLPANDE